MAEPDLLFQIRVILEIEPNFLLVAGKNILSIYDLSTFEKVREIALRGKINSVVLVK